MSGIPSNVTAGPGWLFVAPHETALPTDAVTPLGTGFEPIGFTDDGTTFSRSITRENLQVAETNHPIKGYITEEVTKVMFAMAEATARNLLLALNGGVAVAQPSSVQPVDEEEYVTLVHETVDGARWVWPKCIQTGNVEISSKKAPQKKLIPVEFTLYLPDTGPIFDVFPNADGII